MYFPLSSSQRAQQSVQPREWNGAIGTHIMMTLILIGYSSKRPFKSKSIINFKWQCQEKQQKKKRKPRDENLRWKLFCLFCLLRVIFLSLTNQTDNDLLSLSLYPSLPGLVLQANWRHMEICIENVRLKEWMNELGRDYRGGRERERDRFQRGRRLLSFLYH